MCFVCVLFCAIIPCVAFFDALFVSLSHSTCSAYHSEKAEPSSVCYDIIEGIDLTNNYIDDAFFFFRCVYFFVVFGFVFSLDLQFPSRNKD